MAARKFLTDIELDGYFDLKGNVAKKFRLEDYADNTAPTSNFIGRMIYTTNGNNTDRLELYTADGWKQVAYLDDTPPMDQDLVDIAALTGDGLLRRQSGVWEMDTNTYLTTAVTSLTGTTNQIVVINGDGVGGDPTFSISPNYTNQMYLATDGGIYYSLDRGATWMFVYNLPVGQFYHVACDNSTPYRMYGGLQDNGSWMAPSAAPGGRRTLAHR